MKVAIGLIMSIFIAQSLVARPPGTDIWPESPLPPRQAPPRPPGICTDEIIDGVVYRTCMPSTVTWNGDLIVYAHAYVAPNRPIEIPEEQLQFGGLSLPDMANRLGYAFATTSYRSNGLAVVDGQDDILNLVDVFAETHGAPRYQYLIGASEGGLIAAMTHENHPRAFDGALAACAPIGDFAAQLDYIADFHCVFACAFPGVVPHGATDMENWDTVYLPGILAAVADNRRAAQEVFRITRAPINPSDPTSVGETVTGILWHYVHGTDDVCTKLGGQSFDNTQTWYTGSTCSSEFNLNVARMSADPEAQAELQRNYATSGRLKGPLVTMHTVSDPVVPYWHENWYRWKVLQSGSTMKHTNIPIFRFGHCNFSPGELLGAFAALVWEVQHEPLHGIDRFPLRRGDRVVFEEMVEAHLLKQAFQSHGRENRRRVADFHLLWNP